jgi:hypothetical protein
MSTIIDDENSIEIEDEAMGPIYDETYHAPIGQSVNLYFLFDESSSLIYDENKSQAVVV